MHASSNIMRKIIAGAAAALPLVLALAACGTRGAAPVAQPAASAPAAQTATSTPPPPAPLSPTPLPPSPLPPSSLPSPSSPAPISGPGFEGVIFDEPRARAINLERSAGVPVDGYWTPTPADVQALEGGILAFLQGEAGKDHPTLTGRLPEYKRQYIGVQSGGQRLIFANFFCRDLGIDWKQDYVEVADGGDCFFTVLYDADSGAFSGLNVNGEA